MKLATKLLAALLCIFITNSTMAQNISNKGKDFWVAYGYHQFMSTPPYDNSQNMTIYLSVEDLPPGKTFATVTLEADSSDPNPNLWWKRTYHINANTVISVGNTNAFSFSPASALGNGPIPKGILDAGPSGTPPTWDFRLYNANGCPNPVNPKGFGTFKGRGLHIKSDVDIVAYAHIYGSTSSGATMLLPTSSWGYSYTTINSNQNNADFANGFFYIIAQEDSTVVKITPAQQPIQLSCVTATPLVPYTVTLHKGWVYQYIGYLDNNSQIGVQLTGSKIESIPNAAGKCKKIAVFAGCGRTGGETGAGCTNSSRDNDMQQCFPEHTWGNYYLSAPFAIGNGGLNACGSAGSVYKIVAKDTGTYVKINGGTPTLIPSFGFVTYASNAPCKFEGNKPIAVAQFMTSGNCNTGDGDPEMIYLSPVDQAISKVGFYRQDKESINENYVSIIIPDSGMASLKINGQGLATNFGGNSCVKVHPQDNRYKIVVKGWTAAAAQVLVTSDARFNTITYGLGGAESYGYSGGTYLNNLAAAPNIVNVQDTTVKNRDSLYNYAYTFDRTPLELRTSITYPPKRLDWLFGLMAYDTTLIDTNKITLQRVCDGVKFKDVVDTQRGYFYTPPFQYVGNDTFYVKGCSPANVCTNQMHVVTVGCPLTANLSTKYVTLSSGLLPYTGNVVTDMAPSCGNAPYKFTYVDAFGNPKTNSNRGGFLTPATIPANGKFNYIAPTPANQFNGKDTFYIRLCDNGGIAPTTCLIKMYVITVGPQFGIDTVVILNGTNQNTPLINNAATELNAVGGKTPYSYSSVDANGTATAVTSAGGTIVVAGSNYTYTPAALYTGLDSFYIKVCDNNNPNSCAIQKHIITVGLPFTANTGNVINNTTINTTYRGSASIFSNVAGGIGSYTYSLVNGVGANTTTSNKGCTITIKPNNGLFVYTPTTGLTGVDSFYVKVCDGNATPNCSTQLYIVNINSAFTGNTAVIKQNVNNASQISGTANTEINAVGGTINYTYDIVNSLFKPNGNASGRGGTLTIVASTGAYTYTPPANYIGQDTFYVRVQDASTTPNALVQMHIVSVFPAIIGNSLPFYHNIAGDKNLSGNLLLEMPSLPRTSLTTFIPVNTNGNYFDSSSRKGLISMIPLPIDTIHDAVRGDRYIYKALPTLIPACDYIFIKKDTINDRIDTVYIPVVVYSKPVNGLPTGCYGAGGLVGDTIKLPYVIYPNPRIYRKNLITTPSCPTDSVITFRGVDSSIKVTIGAKTLISPAIRWIWKISGTYKNNPVNYLDTAKVTTHAFDTGSVVCVSLTTIFTYGAVNHFDTCFKFLTSKVKFGVFPLRLCLGQPIKVLDSTFSRTGVDSIYWNFGDGKFITYSKGFDTNYVYKDTGSFTIKHTVKINGCNAVIDTVVQKVYVSAKRFPVIVSPLNCIDTSGKADFWYDSSGGGVPIQSYRWFFGDPASGALDSSHLNPTSHTYPKENSYAVKLYVVDTSGCKGDTTTTVNIHILPNIYFKPFTTGICANGSPISIKDSAGCLNKQRVQGYGKFKGPGITDTIGIFDPTKANLGVNTIWYIYTSGSGACVDSVAQQITVWAKPTVDFSYSPTGCLPKDGIASFLNLTTNGFSFLWNFDDAANSTASNPNVVDSIHTKHTFANTGLHNIKLVATSADGCKDSVSKAITFSVTPAINYPAFPAAGVCESQTTVPVNTASITNGVSLASGNYYGNGVSLTGSLSPAVSGYGQDSLTYIATSTGGCADTAIQYILVKARPRIGFTYPAGCLPANGIVQFTDTSKIPDGQTVQSCTWNFGHSSAGNPATANVCSPSHTYPYGTFTIYHTVTSSLGCTTDTTFNATFNISPSLYYNTIPDVCENVTSYSVAFAGSNNLAAVPGSGEYHGAGITNVLTGDFNPFNAGAGAHTIWYVFNATSGCKDSISKTFNVNARPKGQFTFTPNGCLNASGLVQFDASGISVQGGSSILSYNWKFEGINSPIKSETNPKTTHNYSDGTDTILLNIQAANGCSFDTMQVQTFSRQPSLGAFTHNAVCENVGIITIAGAVVTNGVILKDSSFHSSKGAFIDSIAGKYDPSIAGYGIDTITYTVHSLGNCDTSTTLYLKIDAKPRNTFTINPNGTCLDTTGKVTFDASAIDVPGSSVASYSWNFGNGSLGTGISPSSNFNEGNDTIKLTVLGNNNCSVDISMPTVFKKLPHIDAISLAYICTNGGVDTVRKPAILNGVSGTGIFNSGKNAITAIVNGNAVYDPSISGYGTDVIKYIFTSTGGCVDSVTFNATVLSRPTGKFTFTPAVGTCLDTIGTVQFDASTITAPGSSISGYTWNFGDGTLPLNTGLNPVVVHYYTKDSTYKINLRIDAANGCWFDTSMSPTFNKTPHIAPISHSPVCENDAVFKIDTAVVLNGATGTWSFSSTKNAFVNTTTGDYDPSKAGWGIDTIYCKFLSNNGVCSATDTMYLTIKSKPTGSFTYSPLSSCLDTMGTVNFDATNVTSADGSSIVNYDWFFENGLAYGSGLKPTHLYNDGTYKITLKATASNGCSDSIPSITKTFNKTPHIAPISHSPVCENDAIFKIDTAVVLNGATGTWSFSSTKNAFVNTTTGDYDPSKAGWGIDTIYCKFLSSNGVCFAVDTMYLTIKSKPTGSFTYSPLSSCLNTSGTVSFDASGVTSQDGTAISTYNWLFENGAKSGTGIKPVHNYADGIYTISLKAIGANGCSDDIPSITDTFYRKPVITNISNSPVCENDLPITIAKAIVTNGATIVDSFFHSSKGAFTDSISGLYNPTVAGYGIDTITYTVVSKGGCSTSTTFFLRVNAKPTGNFTFSPPGCLDATGLVKFSTNAIRVPGSSPKKYYWQFESSSSPIDSSGGYPKHNYAEGTYTIILKVLGNNGCSATDSITQSFRRTPSLDPIVIKNVCANDAPFLLTAPAVNNGVVGPTGVFTSYKNAVTGNGAVGYTYTPLVGSYIIDTIYYKFISNNGCEANVKKVININPVPQIKLKVFSDVCMDTTTKFRDVSTIKSGHIDSTWWHFYDSTYINPLGGIIDRSFDSAAVYTIYFTAKSDSGCISNDSAKITARPRPVALFDKGAVVCMPRGTVYFTNKSTLTANGGTMSYNWNFGDAAGSNASNPNTAFTKDAKHTYTNIQNYPVSLTVGSKEYGCYSTYYDTMKLQQPFYQKPIASFGVTKDTLCEGQFTTFFDTTSTALGSNLFSWTWDYGDGTTPNTTTVPRATYAYSTAANLYTATLMVRNTQLCESEPATKTIVVYRTPHIDSIPVIYAVDGTVVRFNPKVKDSVGISFTWSAPTPYGTTGLSNSNILRPYLMVTQYPPFGVSNPAQVYTLYAEEPQYHCIDSANQIVRILGKITVPNAFSPNGDGINDTWKITSLADYPGATLDIFDRYGAKIVHLSGNNMVWDGTVNGNPVPVATYYYVIDPGNKMPLVTGWVVLLR